MVFARYSREILEARPEDNGISWRVQTYHQWSIEPDYGMTLAEATDRVEELVTTAVERQLESDVPLAALLSGGIDSSPAKAAAQSAVGGWDSCTFNVRVLADKALTTRPGPQWRSPGVTGSDHQILDMEDGDSGPGEHITDLLSHAGQPFADTSLFAVNAVSRLMRKHVTVALSGDGGDEAFGGYKFLIAASALMSQLQKFSSGKLAAALDSRFRH